MLARETPSSHFNLPVIGTVLVKDIPITDARERPVPGISGKTFDVIGTCVLPGNLVAYVTNAWHREARSQPLTIAADLVARFDPA